MEYTFPVTRNEHPKPKPTDESALGFGKYFTDHMLIMEYDEGQGRFQEENWNDCFPQRCRRDPGCSLRMPWIAQITEVCTVEFVRWKRRIRTFLCSSRRIIQEQQIKK